VSDNRSQDPYGLFKGLFLLIALGTSVGLGVSGQWKNLLLFSVGIMLAQGAFALASEHRSKRKDK
jgi:hypothetical protein